MMMNLVSAWSNNTFTNELFLKNGQYSVSWETSSTDYYIGQLFKIGSTGVNKNFNLSGVYLEMSRYSNPGTVYLEIRTVNSSGIPNETILTSTSINGNLLSPDYNWESKYLYFNNPIILNNDTNYAIMLNMTDYSSSSQLLLKGASLIKSLYHDGNAFLIKSTGVFDNYPTYDILFKLIGNYNTDITKENLTFNTNNKTRYFQIPSTVSKITNSYINISTNSSGINNTYLKIINDTVYNYTRFNNTNNKTNNFANYINKYLVSDYLTDGYYYIPLLFYSNTSGYLEYSDIILNNNGFLENSQSYSSVTYETKNETFTLNFTYDGNYYTSVIGYLVYNGDLYYGTISSYTDYSIISKQISIPSLSDTTVNNFYWIINMTNSSGTYSFNSTNHTQTANPIRMNICNETYNQSYINFSIHNSVSPYQSLNGTLKAYFEFYLGDGSTVKNYSYEYLYYNKSYYSFCFLPSDFNYTLNAQIGYEGSGYAKNYYYIDGLTVTNRSQVVLLYLLNETLATLTELKVVDKSQTPIEDIIIEIQRYDLGTDTYYLVSMAKSNYDGVDIAYLNWYDTLYKFILKQNGTIVKSTNPYKISETPQTFTIGEDTIFEYDKFDNIDYSLIYNNNTKNFILTYSSSDSSVKSYCLRVIKRSVINDTIICNTCEVSSSATLYCNINAYGNGTYYATFYATGSFRQIEILTEIVGSINELYEEIGTEDGAIYSVILGLIILFVFFVSPALGIIGAILGLVVNMVFGFIPLDPLTFTGVVILGGVIIWLLKR